MAERVAGLAAHATQTETARKIRGGGMKRWMFLCAVNVVSWWIFPVFYNILILVFSLMYLNMED